jgi:hypothetical protein
MRTGLVFQPLPRLTKLFLALAVAIVGHVHYYARNVAQYPNANNGTGAYDTACVGPNLGNATNPRAVYTNCKYMPTVRAEEALECSLVTARQRPRPHGR